ncbi:hypothetical protein D3C78_1653960 [compost metagenome]
MLLDIDQHGLDQFITAPLLPLLFYFACYLRKHVQHDLLQYLPIMTTVHSFVKIAHAI